MYSKHNRDPLRDLPKYKCKKKKFDWKQRKYFCFKWNSNLWSPHLNFDQKLHFPRGSIKDNKSCGLSWSLKGLKIPRALSDCYNSTFVGLIMKLSSKMGKPTFEPWHGKTLLWENSSRNQSQMALPSLFKKGCEEACGWGWVGEPFFIPFCSCVSSFYHNLFGIPTSLESCP